MKSGFFCSFTLVFLIAYFNSMDFEQRLKRHIRIVHDFPILGISFKDISPIFLNPELVRECAHHLAAHWRDMGITKVIGVDSRGFLFGPQLAEQLDAGFVLVRKKGKLPPETVSITYELEYGEATIESIKEALHPGDKVVIHDDLLATGGTANAAAELAKTLGAEVMGFSFLIALNFLDGAEKLIPYSKDIHALVHFDN